SGRSVGDAGDPARRPAAGQSRRRRRGRAVTGVTEGARSLPVPDGLDGLRLDVAVARLFGLSRTAAAELVDGGAVTVDGGQARKSDRVRGGAWLEVELPAAPAAPAPVAVPGLAVVFEDDDV